MQAPELIASPYYPPACNVGDWINDEQDGLLEVGGQGQAITQKTAPFHEIARATEVPQAVLERPGW